LSGANLGDILALRNENIVNGEVCFRRRKTRKSGLITVIPFTSVAEEIMRRYGVLNPAKPSDYILPYLVNCTTQKSIDNKIHDVIKRINKGLESISRDLNLWKLTTYHARHTYGAHAQSVLSAEQLQKFFGHTSSRTTQTYLQSISRSVRDKNRELLERIVPK
jgi:integrase